MPLIPDPDEAEGPMSSWVLTDATARPLARLRLREQNVSRFRSLPGVRPDRLAAQVVLDLAGRRLTTTDEPVARALVGVGGLIERASTDMLFPLTEVPAPTQPADGWTIVAHDWDEDLPGALRAAYGPSHPDNVWLTEDRVTRLRSLIDGDHGMPLLAGASARLRGPDGRTAGQVVTVGPVPWSEDGPWAWVLDVAVTPAAQGGGLGAALLGHALRGARRAEMAALGLTVTDGNRARRLYDRTGFRPYTRTFTLRVPSS